MDDKTVDNLLLHKVQNRKQTRFQEFCEETTLDGWYYLSKRNMPWFKKVFWGLVILGSISTAAVFIHTVTIQLGEKFVITTIGDISSPMSSVLFPSVVVCNLNGMRSSFGLELNLTKKELKILQDEFLTGRNRESTQEEKQFVDKFLFNEDFIKMLNNLTLNYEAARQNPFDYFDSRSPTMDYYTAYKLWQAKEGFRPEARFKFLNNDTLRQFGEKFFRMLAGQPLPGQMIPHFDWSGIQSSHCNLYQLVTDIGLCSFVSAVKDQEKPWSDEFYVIKPGANTGEQNGIRMMLDAETFDHAPSQSLSTGFKLGLMHNLDVPLMQQKGLNIGLGTNVQIAVTPELVDTTSVARSRFGPEQRNCYFEGELLMKDYKRNVGFRYEMTNCLMQATYDQIKTRCLCDPAYVEVRPNICRGQGIVCLKDVTGELGQWTNVFDTKTQSERPCLTACEDTLYKNVIVTSADYPNHATFMTRHESCVIAKKLVKTCSDFRKYTFEEWYPGLCIKLRQLADADAMCSYTWDLNKVENLEGFNYSHFKQGLIKYTRENIAMVTVFIREPFATKIQVDQFKSTIDFISNVGGLMGLCMGFSMVTLVELSYHMLGYIVSYILPPKEPETFIGRRDRRLMEEEASMFKKKTSKVTPVFTVKEYNETDGSVGANRMLGSHME